MNGDEMRLLGARLAAAGYTVHRYRYRSLRAAPAVNAAALAAWLDGVPGARVHFVAHSLGGIVLRHLFASVPALRPGRVVTLGTPHTGSAAAAWLASRRWSRPLIGRAADQGLLGPLPPWPAERALGSVAGRLRVGLGCIVPGVPRPSDGTVAVAETLCPGMAAHLVLPVSHFGLLLSRRAAAATIAFIDTGRFDA